MQRNDSSEVDPYLKELYNNFGEKGVPPRSLTQELVSVWPAVRARRINQCGAHRGAHCGVPGVELWWTCEHGDMRNSRDSVCVCSLIVARARLGVCFCARFWMNRMNITGSLLRRARTLRAGCGRFECVCLLESGLSFWPIVSVLVLVTEQIYECLVAVLVAEIFWQTAVVGVCLGCFTQALLAYAISFHFAGWSSRLTRLR
eukprot:2468972-Pyramimonas_sp.AAC.1